MTQPLPTSPRVALVTGAGSGIGRAVALALSHAGFSLALVGRRELPLRETASLLPNPFALLPCDLADPHAAADLPARVISSLGRLDALVNNAAIARPALIGLASPDDIAAMFAANAAGPVALINAAWPHLEHAARERGRATIVNISSMATLDPFPNLFAYAASKAALNVAAIAAHNAGHPLGIRAFSLAPGAVETSMLREVVPQSILPPTHTLRPDAIAAVALECIQGLRDAASGQTIPLPSPSSPSVPPNRLS